MAFVPDAKRQVPRFALICSSSRCAVNVRRAGAKSESRNATWNIWRGPASGEAAVYAAKARCATCRLR